MSRIGSAGLVRWLVLVMLLPACQAPDQSAPTAPSFATDAWCAANPGRCETEPDEPSDPSPTSAGYWMGSTISWSTCVSSTGAGISDGDHDGLSDYCEDFMAQRFRPALIVSPYDCNLGMEPYWAAKVFPSKGVVRIAYLPSYYQDCGPPQPPFLCTVGYLGGKLLTFNGLIPTYYIGPLPISAEDQCASHQGDSEFVTVDLKYNGTTQHWYVAAAFFSSHYGSTGDHSRRATTGQLEYPEKYGGYFRVYVAEGKHANYPTRAECDDDGGKGDMCVSNYPVVRVRHGVQYNVGSARYNFINAGTCVKGGALVATYPANYGTECYWKAGDTFQGWSKYALANDASPYRTFLIAKFECYSYTVIATSSGWQVSCTDWGVNT